MGDRLHSGQILKNVGLGLLREGKTIRIKAHGYSMYPSIKPGSVIIIEPLRKKPSTGEILAIKRETGLIIHRLIKIIKKNNIEYFIARGDSNALTDNPVTIQDIAGKVVKAESSSWDSGLTDLRTDVRPEYFLNRIRVVILILTGKLRKRIRSYKPGKAG